MIYATSREITEVFKHLKTGTNYLTFRCFLVLVSITTISSSSAFSQTVRVGLLNRTEITSVLFSPKSGKYVLLNAEHDTVYRFRSDDAISIVPADKGLLVKSAYGLNDTISEVHVVGSGRSASFKIRVGSDSKEHSYFSNLSVFNRKNLLSLVSDLDVEQYVGRVVQAEVGYGAVEEYYKIQSMICRTYAIRNLERHTLDGYDLCDHEHCQVYSGLKSTSNEVVKATSATSGLIMVDPNDKLILSAFHANCGGQTSNSEDVWKESRTYLLSVEDTFCTESRSATWKKTMPVSEFLAQIGFSTDTTGLSNWRFDQSNRKKFFTLKNDSVETAQMRRLLGLRSTYFDVDVTNGKVQLSGRGYGHGVGLCQQGAMKMAESGYTYSQILGYYYKGVSLIPITSLQPEK